MIITSFLLQLWIGGHQEFSVGFVNRDDCRTAAVMIATIAPDNSKTLCIDADGAKFVELDR